MQSSCLLLSTTIISPTDFRRIQDHGIKANLKSEALIDLLLDTLRPVSRSASETQPKRSTSLRIVSRSAAGSRPRGRSGGSVIIHDTDDEAEDEQDEAVFSAPELERKADSPPATAPRTRKAKETQYRLGVGRPALAGGSGARAITKSMSVSKGKRGKGSRSMKPTEDAIQEEQEEQEEGQVNAADSQAGPSGTSHDPDPTLRPTLPATVSTPPHFDQLKSYAAELVLPLKEELQLLQAESQRLAARMTDFDSLRAQVRDLTSEIEILRAKALRTDELEAEVGRLRESMSALAASPQDEKSTKSAGKARALNMGTPTAGPLPAGAVGQQLLHNSPGIAPTLLGKRHRDSEDSHATGMMETGKEDGLGGSERANKVMRPSRKRAKLSQQDTDDASPLSPPRSPDLEDMNSDEGGQDAESTIGHRAPAFTIFRGPEEPLEPYVDPPPPTTRLSDLFGPSTSRNTPPMGSGPGPATSTANAHENTHHLSTFNFSFANSVVQPVTSTPAGASYGLELPAYSYPEPPTSPTPGAAAGPSGGYIERAGGRRERNDLFRPLGGPRRPQSSASSRRVSSRASQSQAGAGQEGTVNPTALLRTPPLAAVPELDLEASQDANAISSNDVGAGLGMGAMPLPPETPAPPMKRTMYGTELDGDTRFGDFGVEGVATGFWTGTAPRF
ncbi:hypothetical protein AcV5_004384 [Taiwanofungus camphoratus]|nr:hypothetical protein AcV5_004384 [Antrodia cinnamomea]